MNTPYPTLNYGLGEDIDQLRDMVYTFSQNEIGPRAGDIDRDTALELAEEKKLITG